MSHPIDRHRLDRAALKYLDAHDAGDLETIAAMWEQASVEPELETLLRELDEGLADELGLGTDFGTDAARVAELARTHIPSAFPPDELDGPLTVSEVARRLEAEPEFRRFGSDDRLTHARFLSEGAVLPEDLGQPRIDRWLRDLGLTASSTYARVFRKVAVLMTMARCQQQGRLAAAREATPIQPIQPKASEPGEGKEDRS